MTTEEQCQLLQHLLGNLPAVWLLNVVKKRFYFSNLNENKIQIHFMHVILKLLQHLLGNPSCQSGWWWEAAVCLSHREIIISSHPGSAPLQWWSLLLSIQHTQMPVCSASSAPLPWVPGLPSLEPGMGTLMDNAGGLPEEIGLHPDSSPSRAGESFPSLLMQELSLGHSRSVIYRHCPVAGYYVLFFYILYILAVYFITHPICCCCVLYYTLLLCVCVLNDVSSHIAVCWNTRCVCVI